MIKKLPTLSKEGFTNNPKTLVRKLLYYFLISYKSQTKIYYPNVKSFIWIINIYSNDVDTIAKETKKELILLYSSYFDDYDIDVTTETIDTDNGEVIVIKFEITVRVNNKSYSLSTEVRYTNGRIVDITEDIEVLKLLLNS